MSVKVDYRLTERFVSDYQDSWRAVENAGLFPYNSYDGKIGVLHRHPHRLEIFGPPAVASIDFEESRVVIRVFKRENIQKVLDLSQTISKVTGKPVEVYP